MCLEIICVYAFCGFPAVNKGAKKSPISEPNADFLTPNQIPNLIWSIYSGTYWYICDICVVQCGDVGFACIYVCV